MEAADSALLAARMQFSISISFHIVLAALSIGLANFLLVLEALWLWRGRQVYLDVYRYWLKVFALNIALGTATGLILEYQFGLNWSRLSVQAGDILGPLMFYEVLAAFFLEAGFLGIMLFGRKRVGERVHTLATVLVAGGTTLSAFWILALNSWMQTPVGFEMIDGQAHPTDWLAILFNPSLVTGSLGKAVVVDENAVNELLNNMPGLEAPTEEEAQTESDAAAEGMGQPPADEAVRLLGRRRNGRGERFASDPAVFAQAIVDQLTQQTVDCLLEAAFDEDPAFAGEASEVLARHRLTVAGLRSHRGVVEITARLGVPVIGLGASAPAYYGAVGDRLGTRMILPEHAGVANAIGAVVGQVSQKVTGIVTSPAEGRFIAHLPDALQTFSSATEALAALESALRLEAETRAKAAGAEDLRITAKRDLREVDIEGRKMFVEASVSVTAAGRPRVAHS